MNSLGELFRRVCALFQKEKLDRDMDEELRFHIERQTEANIGAGMKSEEARYAALRKFGWMENIKETCRDQRSVSFLDRLSQDVRFGLRMAAKTPGFTLVAVLTLALGIGACTAIFSVINTFILNPVPFPGGGRLVEINEIDQKHARTLRVSPPLYHDLESHPEVFEQTASFLYDLQQITGGEFVENLLGAQVTPSFFDLLSAQPVLGRVLQSDEGTPGKDDVLVISHSLWQSRFGGDAKVIGRTLRTSNKTYTIVGVMPAHFGFPSRKTLFWRPFQFTGQQQSDDRRRGEVNWWAIARMRTGVSHEQAQAYLETLGQRLRQSFPEQTRDRVIRLRPLRDFFVAPELRTTFWALLAAISLVLLIVCTNVASLQLGRTEARWRELLVRMALGAGRRRIVGQMLTESVMLSFFGGLGGVLLAVWGVKALSLLVPGHAPLVRPLAVDRAMLLFSMVLSLGTGIAAGLLPAWYATRVRLHEALKETGSVASASRGHKLIRSGLVVGEVALAVVLLVGAGLMIQSLAHMLRVDPGYDPRNVARIEAVGVLYGQRAEPEKKGAEILAMAERVSAIPKTTGVGFWVNSMAWRDWQLEGVAEPIRLRSAWVGTGRYDFFRALRIPLREGHLFDETDVSAGQTTVIVNERLAKLCWPGTSAIGKRLRSGTGKDVETRTVVGVVGDVKEWDYEKEPEATMYEPFQRRPAPSVEFFVRTSLDPASLMQVVQRDVKETISDAFAPKIDWMEQVLWASTYSRRLYMMYLCAFAGIGLFLAALGLFAVLAHSVVRRTREIGVRLALGAQAKDVRMLVIAHGMTVAAGGITVGLAGAFAATRLLRGLLFNVSPLDPLTFAVVPVVLVLAALCACWLPARRAAKLDPMVALRYE
jgi:putative ABC transport system permease protein